MNKYKIAQSLCVTYQSDSDYRPGRQITKDAQHRPQPQALTRIPDFLYSRGA